MQPRHMWHIHFKNIKAFTWIFCLVFSKFSCHLNTLSRMRIASFPKKTSKKLLHRWKTFAQRKANLTEKWLSGMIQEMMLLSLLNRCVWLWWKWQISLGILFYININQYFLTSILNFLKKLSNYLCKGYLLYPCKYKLIHMRNKIFFPPC